MIKNPYINAVAAEAYIILVSSFMFYASDKTPTPDSVFAPITMLSLLVLSVSIMALLFFVRPAQLYFDGAKDEALRFLVTTIITFAVLASVSVFILFFVMR